MSQRKRAGIGDADPLTGGGLLAGETIPTLDQSPPKLQAKLHGGRRSRTAAERPHFVLVLRPEPGIDGARALRRFLKVALRSFRLRCLSAEEVRP
jgi:hypothetical protein